MTIWQRQSPKREESCHFGTRFLAHAIKQPESYQDLAGFTPCWHQTC
jgi:hypothetical protein